MKKNFRKEAIATVDYRIERYKRSNSVSSCTKKWLFKCFEHFYNTYNDVDEHTKGKISTVIDSIKQNFSEIEEKIDSYATNSKNQINTANADDYTMLEFQRVLRSYITNEFEEGISNGWKKVFQNFEASLNDILNIVNKSYVDTKWYQSLTKIHRIYIRSYNQFSIGSLDYFCLKEKLCIVCNEKSHRIDFDEELAKKDPTGYTYHGDSAFELSLNYD